MANSTTEKKSGLKVEHKLLLTLFVSTFVPVIGLGASLALGMYQTYAIIAALVFQVVGLVLGYMFSQGIVKQASAIQETLQKINGGNLEARATTFTRDELGRAAESLNAMCDNSLNMAQSNDERDQIQNSIEGLISEMKSIAEGDLTIQTVINEDVTGTISTSVNSMTDQLRSIVTRVKSAAEQVTHSSSQIREASTEMFKENEMQAVRIGEASEQLLDITGSFQNVAEMTKESVQVAVEARQTASNGLKAVSATVDGMQRIRNQVQSTSKRIKRLGESSQEIGEIVQMISDITDRTSILALNASIQASMAGDAGQGFAVVAEEIERLAERSNDATKQISKLIRSVQNETSEVISDMEESTREVVAGSQLASEAGETLFEIDSVSNQLVELIQSSSTYALEQADTATQVASSMSAISTATRLSAERGREATQSIGLLANMVGQLRDSVSRFKVSDAEMVQPALVSNSFSAPSQTSATLMTPDSQNSDAANEARYQEMLKQVREQPEEMKVAASTAPKPPVKPAGPKPASPKPAKKPSLKKAPALSKPDLPKPALPKPSDRKSTVARTLTNTVAQPESNTEKNTEKKRPSTLPTSAAKAADVTPVVDAPKPPKVSANKASANNTMDVNSMVPPTIMTDFGDSPSGNEEDEVKNIEANLWNQLKEAKEFMNQSKSDSSNAPETKKPEAAKSSDQKSESPKPEPVVAATSKADASKGDKEAKQGRERQCSVDADALRKLLNQSKTPATPEKPPVQDRKIARTINVDQLK